MVLIGYVLNDKFVLFESIVGIAGFFLMVFGLNLFMLVVYNNPIRIGGAKLSVILITVAVMNAMYFIVPIFQQLTVLSIVGSITRMLKFGVVLMLIIFVVGNARFSFEKFASYYINIAVFASASSLLYYAFHVIWDINLPVFGIYSHNIGGYIKSYFLLGSLSSGNRVMYYFTEPSKFALFLLPAFFLEIYKRNHDNRRTYWKLSAIAATIALTGSFAVWLGILVALLFLFFARFGWKGLPGLLVAVALMFFVGWEVLMFFSDTANSSIGLGFFYKFSSLAERLGEYDRALSVLDSSPAGLGFYGNPIDSSGLSWTLIPMQDLVRGGWWYMCFNLVCYLLFLLIAFKDLFNFGWNKKSSVLALIMVGLLFSDFTYGPFVQGILLVFLALWIMDERPERTGMNARMGNLNSFPL